MSVYRYTDIDISHITYTYISVVFERVVSDSRGWLIWFSLGYLWEGTHCGSTTIITPSHTSTRRYSAALTTLIFRLHLSTRERESTHHAALFMTVGVVGRVTVGSLHQVKSRRKADKLQPPCARSLLFDLVVSFIILKPGLMLPATRLAKPLERLPVLLYAPCITGTGKGSILGIIFKYND